MRSNTEMKQSSYKQWKWFIGLYVGSIAVYGLIELGVHYLNSILKYL
jgi:hypothetical protein